MMKHFLLLLILCTLSFYALGQSPTAPTFSGYHPSNGPDVRVCTSTSWLAGTSNQALDVSAQSNDVEYLCFNDALNITHNGDFNLDASGDPIPATASGISYVFYDCTPTATGSDVQDVESDGCIVNNPPPGSVYSFYLDGVVNAGGNGTFTNNGGLQGFFNGGNPIELFFAPITIHNHLGLAFESSNGSDFCVNLNAADAFRVVYLNQVNVSNVVNNNGGNDCEGTFVVEGGLPQFDLINGSSSSYTITILKQGAPAVTGSVVGGTNNHTGTIVFSVPEAGIYDILVEDGKSCAATATVDMSACVQTLGVTNTSNNVSCNGLSDGGIDVDITGGAGAYTINWQLQPGGAVQNGTLATAGQFNISNLSAGQYGVTVTDANGTSVTENIQVTQPGALGASLINLTPPTCNGDSDGSVSVQITSDGVIISPDASYTFTWNIPQSTETITNLPFGPYSVTVTDGNGCSATASATLSQPPAITAPPIAAVNASCIGIGDGSATINPSGGTGTLTYLWSDTNSSTTATASNLEPGTYTVTVTDDNACTYSDNVIIGAATVLTANAIATDISCNGANDGSITAQGIATGVDNGGYTFAWSPNVGATATINTLSPDTYTVTVTDANGCTATASAIINEPSALTITTSAMDESCNIGNDGQVSATVNGGTPIGGSYNYSWSNSGTTATITGLVANTYTVTVTDANSCSITATDIVSTPSGPVITSFDTVGILCATDMNGSITVNAVQGSTPITGYTWSNNMVSGATNANIGPGTYIVSITDAGGCITTGSQSLTAPPPLAEASSAVVTSPFCPGGGEGTITLDITGGVPPYNYSWDNGAAGPAFGTLTNLTAGNYIPTITDANGCSLVLPAITVNDPPAINVIFQNIQPVSCFGGIPCDGAATAIASGGLSTNYTFTWASGETSTGGNSTAVALCQGNQTVTVTDGFCTVTFDMTGNEIPAPPMVSIANIQTTDVTCFGDSDGSATITPTGGDGGPYTINWSNNQTGPTATNLAPNTSYNVSITDGLGCASIPFTITIGEPAPLELLIIDTVDIGCSGENNGIIQVAPAGGNQGTFSYQWSPNTTNTLNVGTGLGPGIYSITVTDDNGCTASNSAVISEPDPITLVYTEPEEPTCHGETTVFALDSVYGGVGGPYVYTIDGFNYQSIEQASPILAGDYIVEVIDAGFCTETVNIIVDEPAPIIVDLGPDVEIQLGDTIELIPSITPLGAIDTLSWTPDTWLSCTDCFNPIAQPLDDVVYTLTVTDDNGCTGSDDIFIDVDPNRNVFIPNIFSPNGDGANDIFIPYFGVGVKNINKMQIFDRWGNLVFAADNFLPNDLSTNGWDGNFNGRAMDPAVFVYMIEIEFLDDEVFTYKGDVTLAR